MNDANPLLPLPWAGARTDKTYPPGMPLPAARFKRRIDAVMDDSSGMQALFSDDIRAIAADRDRDAFARLFLHFAPRVKSYLTGGGVAPLVAEELAQDTMLIVWNRAASFDPSKAGAATWIFTIARNLRIDFLRRERSAASIPYEEAGEDPPQADAILATARRDSKLRAMLKQLSADQLSIVQLAFFQDRSHAEIAQHLGIPLGTVKSRIRLAITRLRALLDDL